jgi:hypothetical protein
LGSRVSNDLSYRFREEVRIGALLPAQGVTLCEAPSEYHMKPGYRYDRPVIVELRSGFPVPASAGPDPSRQRRRSLKVANTTHAPSDSQTSLT